MNNNRSTLAIIIIIVLAVAGLIWLFSSGGNDNNGSQKAHPSKGRSNGTITVNWGTEPPSLDPGLATDTTSSNILLNIMDPLIKLKGDDLHPVGNLATSWDISPDKTVYTFHLRTDSYWTNGDPVVAGDFVYSWRRTVSPELAADYAYQFYAIKGACEYNTSGPPAEGTSAADDLASDKATCGGEFKTDRSAEQVGVKALDDHTLQVTLNQPTPWFITQLSHHSFLAINRKAVDKYGDKWTEADNIITNGPFKLQSWSHKKSIVLVRNDAYRDADKIDIKQVNGRMIENGLTAIQAFERGETDVQIGNLPPEEIDRLQKTADYQRYPALGTYYYGFNVKNITDVNQRRAMAMAIDQQSIIDNVAKAGQLPATGFTAKGIAGFDTFNPNSPWLKQHGDLPGAKALMKKVPHPVTDINLFYNTDSGHKAIATAVQSMWKQLGLKVTLHQQEFDPYLEFLGPPPNKEVDVYRLGWIGDFPDAYNFLELWRCTSGNNNTNFCDPEYDSLVRQAAQTSDDNARFAIYKKLEDRMFGPEGSVPTIPIYFYTYVNLEDSAVRDTFNLNTIDQVDLAEVKVKG